MTASSFFHIGSVRHCSARSQQLSPDSRHATAAMLPSVLCSTCATVMSHAGRLRQ